MSVARRKKKRQAAAKKGQLTEIGLDMKATFHVL